MYAIFTVLYNMKALEYARASSQRPVRPHAHRRGCFFYKSFKFQFIQQFIFNSGRTVYFLFMAEKHFGFFTPHNYFTDSLQIYMKFTASAESDKVI